MKDSLQIKDFIVMDVPVCFMLGYEHYINEFNIPDMEVHAPNPEHSSHDYNKKRRFNKRKPPKCKACKDFDSCEGVWPEYLDIHGEVDIIPVK
jgi:hypothetical protein